MDLGTPLYQGQAAQATTAKVLRAFLTNHIASANTGALFSCRLFLTPMINAFNAITNHISEQLNQDNWSVFYLANWYRELDGKCDLQANLTFADALSLIMSLPVKDSDLSTDFPERGFDPETGLASIHGPYLAFGIPRTHQGECDAVCITPTFTFTKQEVEAFLTV